jgi:hypothetical protein
MKDLKEVIKWSLLTLVAIAILVLGVTALNGTLYPWWLSIQRKSVEQSKSFTDANNSMLQKYIQEYTALETKKAEAGDDNKLVTAYESQQIAIVNMMCQETSTMAAETVKPSTRSWLSTKGGCR